MRYWLVFLGFVFLIGSLGCRDRNHTYTTSNTNINTESHLLNPDDLDAESITTLMKDDSRITDYDALEAAINDPSSGINNVDVDKDGMIDLVKIKELPDSNATARKIVFYAIPSSTKLEADAVELLFAEVTTTETSMSYTENFRDYDSHYYSYHHDHGSSALLAYMFLASRPMYYAPMMPAYYAPRPVMMTRSSLTQQRSSYRQSRGLATVTPAKRTVKPATFTPPKTSASRFAPKARPTGQTLGSRGGTTKKFQPTPGSKPAASGYRKQSGGGITTPRTSPRPSVGGGGGGARRSSYGGGGRRRR